jgi:hypothetical protein
MFLHVGVDRRPKVDLIDDYSTGGRSVAKPFSLLDPDTSISVLFLLLKFLIPLLICVFLPWPLSEFLSHFSSKLKVTKRKEKKTKS